jgi:hypothetical protein
MNNGFGQWGQPQQPQQPLMDPNQGTVGPTNNAAAAGAPGPSPVQQFAAQLPPVMQQPVNNVPLWEWAGVALVGVLLGMTARTFGVQGVATGAALYVLGYWVRGRRPPMGWRYLPSPVFAALGPAMAGPQVLPQNAPNTGYGAPGVMQQPGAGPTQAPTVMVDHW